MSGMSSTNLRTTATIIEQGAFPSETNVIWQAIWMPKSTSTPQ